MNGVSGEATPLKNKSFSFYDDLCIVFGKDHACGKEAETAADVLEELHREDVVNDVEENNTNTEESIRNMFSQDQRVSHSQSEGSSTKKKVLDSKILQKQLKNKHFFLLEK